MSGGYFDYVDGRLCDEIFGIYPEYDLDSEDHKICSALARNENRLKDKDISELVYDALCLVHSFDCWQSDDTDESQYRQDVETFKKKWRM